MKKGITISLIIATYNWPEALRLCLDSILRHSHKESREEKKTDPYNVF